MNQGNVGPSQSAVWSARVSANKRVCHGHYRLSVQLAGKLDAVPGQFVEINCSPSRQLPCLQECDEALARWGGEDSTAEVEFPRIVQTETIRRETLLNRPFSIAAARPTEAGLTELDILFKVRGPGTEYLAGLRTGDAVELIGPLGRRGFTIPDKLGQAILVGGGVGLPPMMFLADWLAQRRIGGVAIVGAGRRGLLPVTLVRRQAHGERVLACKEFEDAGFESLVATEDGSAGRKGLVTNLMRDRLAGGEIDLDRTVVYACGPWGMLEAVAGIAKKYGLACQVCLEQIMACGMGACQSCAVRLKAGDDPAGWRYGLVCTEGPVFDAREVLWERVGPEMMDQGEDELRT